MPLHDFIDAFFQSHEVQLASYGHRQRHIVQRKPWLQLFKKPDPLLRKGQRHCFISSRSRLFRLVTLTPLDRPAGAARLATAADRDLLITWLTDFSVETGDSPGPPPGTVDDELSYGGLTLWEADGIPVAVAGVKRPAAGVVRVGPVYTPPGQRRHGYAAAATVAVSQAALDAGAAGVVLFTDLASAASNGLYPRLGYQPVADRVMLSFKS